MDTSVLCHQHLALPWVHPSSDLSCAEDGPAAVLCAQVSVWACGAPLTCGVQCPPPCTPQGAAPRIRCYFFLSLVISKKAALQKPLTWLCLSFPSFPNSFSDYPELE